MRASRVHERNPHQVPVLLVQVVQHQMVSRLELLLEMFVFVVTFLKSFVNRVVMH
jgi:hypothetical protein